MKLPLVTMLNKIILTLVFVGFGLSFWSQDYVDCFPEQDHYKNGLVYDLSDKGELLSDNEENILRSKLNTFSDTTSNQILVIITDKLCGMELSQYAIRIGQSWGVGGDSGFDNGIVLLISPERRKMFIATGDGLEGAIPDITAGHIIDNELRPNFKAERFYQGIDEATNVLMALASGEYNHENYGSSNDNEMPAGVIVFLLVFLVAMAFTFFIALKKAKDYAKLNNIGLWAAYILISQANRSHSGRYGAFRGGTGGFGGHSSGRGFGGGGFGGFGGGSFGGGGAGGGW